MTWRTTDAATMVVAIGQGCRDAVFLAADEELTELFNEESWDSLDYLMRGAKPGPGIYVWTGHVERELPEQPGASMELIGEFRKATLDDLVDFKLIDHTFAEV